MAFVTSLIHATPRRIVARIASSSGAAAYATEATAGASCCTCPGHRFRGTCKHAQAAELLRREVLRRALHVADEVAAAGGER